MPSKPTDPASEVAKKKPRAPYGAVKAAKNRRGLLRAVDFRIEWLTDAWSRRTLKTITDANLVGKQVVVRGCVPFKVEGTLERVNGKVLHLHTRNGVGVQRVAGGSLHLTTARGKTRLETEDIQVIQEAA